MCTYCVSIGKDNDKVIVDKVIVGKVIVDKVIVGKVIVGKVIVGKAVIGNLSKVDSVYYVSSLVHFGPILEGLPPPPTTHPQYHRKNAKIMNDD